MAELILVTSADTYLGMHVVEKFLSQGYRVRGTVRKFKNNTKIKVLRSLPGQQRLELIKANILNREQMELALSEVTIVCYIPPTLPPVTILDERSIIDRAVNGTLNILNLAFEIGLVKRIVMTSHIITIMGYNPINKIYNEEDWSQEENQFPFGKSLILAEKAAFAFIEEKRIIGAECFDLVVLNPGYIIGPSFFGEIFIESLLTVFEKRVLFFLNGFYRCIPKNNHALCDVRDLALANFKAAFLAEAISNRHAIVSVRDLVSMKEVSDILYEEFGSKGFKIPREEERIDSILSNASIDNSRMTNILAINPTPIQQTIIETMKSLINCGLVKKI